MKTETRKMERRKSGTTLDRIVSCIRNISATMPTEINGGMTIRGDVFDPSDYLDFVEFLMELEEEFNIDITESDAEAITTVDSIVKIVNGKVKG